LIHGTGASLLTWNGWTDSLKKDYQVIRFDLPAYGLTGPNPTHNYSLDYYADFLGQFLDKLGVKKCVLGGNSLGGAVAWKFALQHPERVSKLILIDAAGYPMQSKSVPVAFQMARFPIVNQLFTVITPRAVVESSIKNVYADPSKVTPVLVEQYWDMARRAGNRAAFVARMTTANQPDNSWQKIKTISAPALIMWGARDLLIPVELGRRFEADLPNDTLVVYQNLGHVPMEEAPAQTVQDVKRFLAKK
jgi:pimeloyl-ACP methyl ester carboxylesterase